MPPKLVIHGRKRGVVCDTVTLSRRTDTYRITWLLGVQHHLQRKPASPTCITHALTQWSRQLKMGTLLPYLDISDSDGYPRRWQSASQMSSQNPSTHLPPTFYSNSLRLDHKSLLLPLN